MSAEEITLEIENTLIVCKKEDLIFNSDYFKAMLEGGFSEVNKKQIKLEGVNLKSMNIILSLLWDESRIIDNEDLLLVLQTACMLQFEKIKNVCVEKITDILSSENCVKIWIVTERLFIKPLYLKAKSMALEEFIEIKDKDCIMYLNLEEIFYYLGHTYLKTDSEMTVFRTLMKWWSENKQQYCNSTKIMLKLLSCIDYNNFPCDYLREVVTYPDIANNVELGDILKCLICIKSRENIEHFSKLCKDTAYLLYKSRNRVTAGFPCLLVKNLHLECRNKNAKTLLPQENEVIYYDNFKRKRFYKRMDGDQNDTSITIFYDTNLKIFKKCFNVDGMQLQNLEGFKLIGCGKSVFMYGGEFLIGSGKWNYNFWMYDTIRERWERKCEMPFPRRHFETCIIGNNIYVIGGTGFFRIKQVNMFSYNIKEDKWSKEIPLPCSDSSFCFKCCDFLNQLFLLNIYEKCGYFLLNNELVSWKKVDLINDGYDLNLSEFCIFSYNNKLYIKGKDLIEYTCCDNKLVVTSVKHIPDLDCDKMEVVVCNSFIYTLYKYQSEHKDMYSLESYNLDTGEIDYVFKDIIYDATLSVDNEDCTISPTLIMFSILHYSLAENNILINSCFE